MTKNGFVSDVTETAQYARNHLSAERRVLVETDGFRRLLVPYRVKNVDGDPAGVWMVRTKMGSEALVFYDLSEDGVWVFAYVSREGA